MQFGTFDVSMTARMLHSRWLRQELMHSCRMSKYGCITTRLDLNPDLTLDPDMVFTCGAARTCTNAVAQKNAATPPKTT